MYTVENGLIFKDKKLIMPDYTQEDFPFFSKSGILNHKVPNALDALDNMFPFTLYYYSSTNSELIEYELISYDKNSINKSSINNILFNVKDKLTGEFKQITGWRLYFKNDLQSINLNAVVGELTKTEQRNMTLKTQNDFIKELFSKLKFDSE